MLPFTYQSFLILILPLLVVANDESYCIQNDDMLECRQMNSTQIPKIDRTVTKVLIADGDFSEIILDVDDNNQIAEIYLINNKMTTVTNNTLKNMSHLEKVDFKYNRLENLPENVIRDHKKTVILDLTGNLFKELPYIISDSLQELDISENQIESINEKVFEQLPNLNLLYMRSNKVLKSAVIMKLLLLPISLYDFDGSVADDCSCDLYHLINIMKDEQLVTVAEPTCMINGKELQPTQADFKEKCSTFTCPTNCTCEEKQVTCTELTSPITESLYIGAEKLNITDSHLGKLNEPLYHSSLNLIEYVSLNNNGITEVSENVFLNLRFLKVLSLCFNKLTSIPKNIIKDNLEIHTLELIGTDFTEMPTLVSKSLQQLDLSQCNIENVNNAALQDLPELSLLYLDNNKIKILESNIYTKTLYISIKHNPISDVHPTKRGAITQAVSKQGSFPLMYNNSSNTNVNFTLLSSLLLLLSSSFFN